MSAVEVEETRAAAGPVTTPQGMGAAASSSAGPASAVATDGCLTFAPAAKSAAAPSMLSPCAGDPVRDPHHVAVRPSSVVCPRTL